MTSFMHNYFFWLYFQSWFIKNCLDSLQFIVTIEETIYETFQISDFKAFHLIDAYRLCEDVEQRTRTRSVSEKKEKIKIQIKKK